MSLKKKVYGRDIGSNGLVSMTKQSDFQFFLTAPCLVGINHARLLFVGRLRNRNEANCLTRMTLVRIGTIWDRQALRLVLVTLRSVLLPYLTYYVPPPTTTPARNPGCGMELKLHLKLEAEGMHHAQSGIPISILFFTHYFPPLTSFGLISWVNRCTTVCCTARY
jgi:hypothetical protein